MTDSELRKLKRSELLEILLDQAREIEDLTTENRQLKKQLEDRRIRIANAGTMAEAAFALNGVFEAADAAVRQYLDNIREKAGAPEIALETPRTQPPDTNREVEEMQPADTDNEAEETQPPDTDIVTEETQPSDTENEKLTSGEGLTSGEELNIQDLG